MPLDAGTEHLTEWRSGDRLSAEKLNAGVRAINRLARGVNEPRQMNRVAPGRSAGGVFLCVVREAAGDSNEVLIAKIKRENESYAIDAETIPALCIPPLLAYSYAPLVWEGETMANDAVAVVAFQQDGEIYVMQTLPWDVVVPNPAQRIEFTDCTPVTRIG